MQKISKIFEFGYLIVAIVFLVETVLNWSPNRERAYLLAFFSFLALFMFFFRRHYRIKNNKKL